MNITVIGINGYNTSFGIPNASSKQANTSKSMVDNNAPVPSIRKTVLGFEDRYEFKLSITFNYNNALVSLLQL